MPQPKTQYVTFLIIIAAAVLGGGNPAFSKLGLREIPPLTFIFLRFAVGTLILLPWLGRGKGKRPTDFLPLILVTLLSTANIILFTYGVKLTTATISQAIYAVVPIFAAILSAIIIREAVTRKKIAGIITGLAGTTLIVFLPLINGAQTGGDLPGNIMILAGAISFSAYTVLSKKLQRSFTPATITLAFMGTTAAVSFWFALTETISNSGMWLSFSSAPGGRPMPTSANCPGQQSWYNRTG